MRFVLLLVSSLLLSLSALGQTPCPPGTFSPTGMTPCQDCPAGTFNDQFGATFCVPCAAGTFSSTVGATACIACAPGFFSPTIGSTSCLACPPGKISAVSGATFCVDCPAGTFQPLSGAVACLLCPPGTFNSFTGAVACSLCPVGTFNPQVGAVFCTVCPAGSFGPTVGAISCQACPPGTVSPGPFRAACVPCLAGCIASLCFGDGNGTPCPCGNNSSPFLGGCLNSAGTGAVLSIGGSTSASASDVFFNVEAASLMSFGVLVSGDNALGGGLGIVGMPPTDGLRCVGGNLRRHGSRGLDANGNNTQTWGPPGGPPGGIPVSAGFVGGQTRYFQVRYREDPLLGPCGRDQNTSQAIVVAFTP